MGLDLSSLFPYSEREDILRKANVAFVVGMDELLKLWKMFADPLRSSLLKAYNRFVLLSHVAPDIVHVSDIVKMLVYGETSEATIIDEEKLRILARGALYHYLFRKKFGERIKAVFEFPVSWYVEPFTVVGNVDIIIPGEEEYYVVELKSTNTESTINFGVLQVKIYWCLLKNYYNLNIAKAYVSTPKTDIEVDKPITKRELKRLVKIYAKYSRRIDDFNLLTTESFIL